MSIQQNQKIKEIVVSELSQAMHRLSKANLHVKSEEERLELVMAHAKLREIQAMVLRGEL